MVGFVKQNKSIHEESYSIYRRKYTFLHIYFSYDLDKIQHVISLRILF